MTKRSQQNESITGRDDYIISQALVYAAGHIQRMPSERQEWSNMADMCQIARTLFPGWLELHVVHFFRAMDFLIDMFPDQDADQTLKAEFENTTRNLINQLTSQTEYKGAIRVPRFWSRCTEPYGDFCHG